LQEFDVISVLFWWDTLKALVAIKNLLKLNTTEALVVRDFCGLDGALKRMRQQLQQLMADENWRDFAMDLETLRREVELIFHGKLDKVKDYYCFCIWLSLLKLESCDNNEVLTGNPGSNLING